MAILLASLVERRQKGLASPKVAGNARQFRRNYSVRSEVLSAELAGSTASHNPGECFEPNSLGFLKSNLE